MKNNLEQNFKDAFDEYELPYNQSAWNALNDKLDQLQSKPPKSTPNTNWKWISGVSLLVISASAVIYAVTNSSNDHTIHQTAALTESTDGKQQQADQIHSVSENQSPSLHTNSSETEHIVINDKVTLSGRTNKVNESVQGNSTPQKNEQENPSASGSNNPIISFPISTELPTKAEQLYFPEINDACEGSVLPIVNKNNVPIFIVSPNGQETEIKASSSVYFTAKEAGTYFVTSGKSSLKNSFVVKEAPKADFTIDLENQYENGIPSILVETFSEGANFTWSFEGSNIKQKGKKAYAHFYKKGTHQVTLTSKNNYGCETTTTKLITVDQDYNLLAPTGFMPLSDDNRKNHFIPVALQHRTTEFRMYIIDPKTGSVIFETSSTEGWNGVDATTNQLVEENTSFIWKVILAHPEPEERNEYKGIIVRL